MNIRSLSKRIADRLSDPQTRALIKILAVNIYVAQRYAFVQYKHLLPFKIFLVNFWTFILSLGGIVLLLRIFSSMTGTHGYYSWGGVDVGLSILSLIQPIIIYIFLVDIGQGGIDVISNIIAGRSAFAQTSSYTLSAISIFMKALFHVKTTGLILPLLSLLSQ